MQYSQPEIRTVNVTRYITPLREGGSLPVRQQHVTIKRLDSVFSDLGASRPFLKVDVQDYYLPLY